jgi:hypothetical protein
MPIYHLRVPIYHSPIYHCSCKHHLHYARLHIQYLYPLCAHLYSPLFAIYSGSWILPRTACRCMAIAFFSIEITRLLPRPLVHEKGLWSRYRTLINFILASSSHQAIPDLMSFRILFSKHHTHRLCAHHVVEKYYEVHDRFYTHASHQR